MEVPLPQMQPPLIPLIKVRFSDLVTNLHEVSLTGPDFSHLEIATLNVSIYVPLDCHSLAGGACVRLTTHSIPNAQHGAQPRGELNQYPFSWPLLLFLCWFLSLQPRTLPNAKVGW